MRAKPIQKLRKTLKSFQEASFWRYLVIGICISLLDFSLFSFLTLFMGITETLSNIFSTVISITTSYFLNSKFVFRAGRYSVLSFVSFSGITLATGLILQTFVIWVFVLTASNVAPELSELIVLPSAKVCAMAIGAVFNYFGYKYIFVGKVSTQPKSSFN